MNRLIYQLMYGLGMTNWDREDTPLEVQQAFEAGDIPAGAALDLGCGTGTHVIYMAMQGRLAIGLDFVPAAIEKARRKAHQAGVSDRTRFEVADVTHLEAVDLPECGFALDMGCFHDLNPDGQRRYAAGLARLLIPGGKFLLYALDPHKEIGFGFGLEPETARAKFAPWFELQRVERGSFWSRGSHWFWLQRSLEPVGVITA